MRLSKQLRQQIVDEFCRRHNGRWDPDVFVDEVRVDPDHPAYGWFEFDVEAAARQHWLDQARKFVYDLRITYTTEPMGEGTVHVTVSGPTALSPLSQRGAGGGYYQFDPNNPEHMLELCRQALPSLRAWVNRYEGAVVHVGGSPRALRTLIAKLSAFVESEDEAA